MKVIGSILLFVIGVGCRHQSPNHYENGLPAGTYVMSCLLLDSTQNGKDTLWRAGVYFDSLQHLPIDTTFFAPCPLPYDGEQAERFFGKEEDLLAYAERKHVIRFCYKDTLGIKFFIHLKKNENYQIASALYGNEGNAITALHDEGWSKLITDSGHWIGDSVLMTGEDLVLACDADAIIKCQYH
jgi:hypothetical protein